MKSSIILISFLLLTTSAVAQAKKSNGQICNKKSDCSSNYCTAGPAPHPESSGIKYCRSADRNCALPGLDGAMYGAIVYKDGTRLVCKNPGNNKWAQFIRG